VNKTSQATSRTGKRGKPLSPAEEKERLFAHYRTETDAQGADWIHIDRQAFAFWRKSRGLPSRRPAAETQARIRRLLRSITQFVPIRESGNYDDFLEALDYDPIFSTSFDIPRQARDKVPEIAIAAALKPEQVTAFLDACDETIHLDEIRRQRVRGLPATFLHYFRSRQVFYDRIGKIFPAPTDTRQLRKRKPPQRSRMKSATAPPRT
jgi:hypothetical protein